MGLLGDILGKTVAGVKQLVTNAQIGKQATAAGFVPGQQVQQQQTSGAFNFNPSNLSQLPIVPILVIVLVFAAVAWVLKKLRIL